jgi:protein phosphatase
MAIALRYAARSDIGLGRYKNNQDSGYAGPHLLVVADGMGGHAGGDVASSVAVGELSALDGESHGSDALQHLEQATRRAHRRLLQRVEAEPDLTGMGTTVTALLRTGNRLVLLHIGDSRAYLLHDGAFSQVTTDHTFVQRLVDEGRITAEEAEHHPQRNVILRVLGDSETSDDFDTSVREAHVGDRWLLCSDGLSGPLSDETMADTLRDVAGIDECADQLVRLALRAGGPDNITCVVADVVEVASVPSSTPQVVGSAAQNRARTSVASGGAAARAASLTARPGDDTGDDTGDAPEEESPGQVRRLLRLAAVLTVLAVLVGGGYAAYAWSQQQYYVGPDSDRVAIYRGLTQDVGPLRLSSVHETQDVALDDLPRVWRDRVEQLIPADDLPDARRIVEDLFRSSSRCEPVPGRRPAPEPSLTPTTPAATPSAPEPGAPAPEPTVSAIPPSPTPSETLTEGCAA